MPGTVSELRGIQPVRRTIPESLRYIAKQLREEGTPPESFPAEPDAVLLGFAISLDAIADEVGDIGHRLAAGERFR